MATDAEESRPEVDLDLEPRLKVKRLNRFAVLLAAMLGIVVLWVAYFVLSHRTPIGPGEARPPQRSMQPERLAIERLRLEALRDPRPPERVSRRSSTSTVEPTSRRRPTRPDPSAAAAHQRLKRALDSDVLAPGFRQGSSRASTAETTAVRLGDLDAAILDRDDGLEAGEPAPRPARLDEPLFPYEIQEGTLIPAILTAGIHSDLPGQTTALVRRGVYDSLTGRHLLIPQGTRLVGSYDHRIAWGQKRILLAWNRLILPDGRSLELGDMPGADLAAMAGVRDQVKNHFVRTFGSALLLSAVSAATQLSQPQESADGGAPSARQIAAAALGQELGQVTAEITRRNIDLQPTLVIRPGYLFNIEVTADLALPGPYPEDDLPR
ncbi:MAG: hypothetical protein GY722_00465 [bacterium]|nr:hypothetical protein [bacterium]